MEVKAFYTHFAEDKLHEIFEYYKFKAGISNQSFAGSMNKTQLKRKTRI